MNSMQHTWTHHFYILMFIKREALVRGFSFTSQELMHRAAYFHQTNGALKSWTWCIHTPSHDKWTSAEKQAEPLNTNH